MCSRRAPFLMSEADFPFTSTLFSCTSCSYADLDLNVTSHSTLRSLTPIASIPSRGTPARCSPSSTSARLYSRPSGFSDSFTVLSTRPLHISSIKKTVDYAQSLLLNCNNYSFIPVTSTYILKFNFSVVFY